MRRLAFAFLLISGCDGRRAPHIPTVVKGQSFDEAALVDKGKVTILDFSADW